MDFILMGLIVVIFGLISLASLSIFLILLYSVILYPVNKLKESSLRKRSKEKYGYLIQVKDPFSFWVWKSAVDPWNEELISFKKKEDAESWINSQGRKKYLLRKKKDFRIIRFSNRA